MLRLLSSDYSNCWNMVCVSNIGNHASPVVIRLYQQLEHDLCQYHRKSCFACCHQTLTLAGTWSVSLIEVIMLCLLSSDYNNCWNMVCVSIIGNHASAVVIRL